MTRDYWDHKLETLPPEQRRVLREHRLRWQVKRCWDGSPFYRARLEAAGLDATLDGGLQAWQRLPALRATDLPVTSEWAVAPESWWARLDEVADHPARVVTDGDAIQQADLMARALWGAGARPGRPFPAPSPTVDRLTRSAIMLGAGRVGAALGSEGAPFAPAAISGGRAARCCGTGPAYRPRCQTIRVCAGARQRGRQRCARSPDR
jgi:hypothetical protein